MKILINQKSQVNWQGLLDSFFRIIRYMNQSFLHQIFFTKSVFFWQNNAKLVRKKLFMCEIRIVLPKQYEIGKNHNVVLQFCGEIFLMERTLGRTV